MDESTFQTMSFDQAFDAASEATIDPFNHIRKYTTDFCQMVIMLYPPEEVEDFNGDLADITIEFADTLGDQVVILDRELKSILAEDSETIIKKIYKDTAHIMGAIGRLRAKADTLTEIFYFDYPNLKWYDQVIEYAEMITHYRDLAEIEDEKYAELDYINGVTYTGISEKIRTMVQEQIQQVKNFFDVTYSHVPGIGDKMLMTYTQYIFDQQGIPAIVEGVDEDGTLLIDVQFCGIEDLKDITWFEKTPQ